MARVGTSIFVVSDLHLGGAEGFQMCEQRGRRRLAALFRWIAAQAGARDVRIVVAGDIVDFLAEEPFEAFTTSEQEATRKLARILAASSEVWQALSEAAAKGVAITLMLGNHDVELAMVSPRRLLLERIGGPVEFLSDNEAFSFGPLLVEHGNRCDGWNAVDHDGLRQLRSRSSRGDAATGFSPQPGSELVARVMNKYKQKYPWVDLLKPETAAVVPILAALGGSTWRVAADAAKAAACAAWRQTQLGSSRFVSETDAEEPSPALPIDELADVFELLGAARQTPAGAADDRMVGEGAVTIDEELLFRGLRMWGEKDNRSFKIDREKAEYYRAANAIARRGNYQVVVFGHTHHAKRMQLDGGATYLNTGTWADLMRVPEDVLTGEESAARAAFRDFMIALKTGVGELRRLLPTFARIDFDAAGNLVDKDVLLFDEGDKTVSISTAEILKRLA